MSPITRRWQKELDDRNDFYDEDAAVCECGHTAREHASKYFNYSCCAAIGHTLVLCACTGFRQKAVTSIVIGSKVRRIDEPSVVLRVREIDPEGLIDGTPKALCTNSYAHGRWMALTDLEVVT